MSDPFVPSSGRWRGDARSDDGWGPATSVRGTGHGAGDWPQERSSGRPPADDGWSRPGATSGREQRASRRSDRAIERQIENMRPKRAQQQPGHTGALARPNERGWSWWAALLVLIVIAGIGGIIDTVGSISVKGGFNIGIVVASVVAILVVKRSHMFPIVIAPPIVYSLAAVFQLYVRSSGLHDKKVVFDAAANYLVYGFPAIAAATAAVLIIAGIRLIARK